MVVGVGGDQMVGLCCGGGWRWRGICRQYVEVVIILGAMFSGAVEEAELVSGAGLAGW